LPLPAPRVVLAGRVIVAAASCALLAEAACTTREEPRAAEREARVVAFYRLTSIDGRRLPITLRQVSPVQGMNLSSGSLSLDAEGRFVGRYRLYSAVAGADGPAPNVTDVEERGRYRRRGGRLILKSATHGREIVLETTDDGVTLRGPLVGGSHPETDTLGLARYERGAIPPPGAR
jgi:hypothetical protein